MCVHGQPEPVGSVLTFPSGYDTLEYSWVKATTVSVHLRILFVKTTMRPTAVLPGVTGLTGLPGRFDRTELEKL